MMQPGKYYVGDLCYVMTNEEWSECCELFFEGRNDHGCNEGEFTLKDGRKFANYNTAYGDGTYQSNIGTSHSVDSGSIGCIRVEDIRANKYDNIESLGAIVEFGTDFVTEAHEGTIQFGKVLIETGYEDEDEDEY